ncbi:hypothetical protein GPECTOR_13g752 [Gonium pectorale]|uniref:Guanylate cyclase domain-containing protein n=1 Tax=Gonium pectorale TaxID=33097 RepID=A0A150GNB3_GONPE|nr:hypothetical protein GPECTOR_13g752 [Gonium pectorale]|eukprot:KXZ51265.1 hypothetical protein GPECTOR_13g752 [Gonium pectorale]
MPIPARGSGGAQLQPRNSQLLRGPQRPPPPLRVSSVGLEIIESPVASSAQPPPHALFAPTSVHHLLMAEQPPEQGGQLRGNASSTAFVDAPPPPPGSAIVRQHPHLAPVDLGSGAPQWSDPESDLECWHEIWATGAVDSVTGQEVIVLTQLDVTAKVIAERHLAMVMESEHRLVEQLFPRHVLKHFTEQWTTASDLLVGGGRLQEGGCHRGSAAAAPEAPPPAAAAAADKPLSGTGADGASCENGPSLVRDCGMECNALATWHPEVTLLFADVKGFTNMCEKVEPSQVMGFLNALYSRFDDMLDSYGVYKASTVETIGDCYFVAGGLIQEDEDGMAAAMLAAAREVVLPTTGEPVELRVGLHTGPVVSGVVGTRMPRFCLFGDTVNTASRMESTGVPGAVHASEATFLRLLRTEGWRPTGGVQVKGKGTLNTYLWQP